MSQRENVIPVYKTIGQTPLDAIGILRKRYPQLSNKKISYAGRLDPMAEGVLLLLVGEENKKRKEYEKLTKSYHAEIILGISTDSFDGMGVIVKVGSPFLKNNEEIQSELQKMVGVIMQPYPPYSSRTVNGKALYWWARNNRISEIRIPQKKVQIYAIDTVVVDSIDGREIAGHLIPRIKDVNGNFRQEEIIDGWNRFAKKYRGKNFVRVKFSVVVSSGTYIRSLAYEIGKNFGTEAFLMKLTRTKVGEYTKDDCVIIKE